MEEAADGAGAILLVLQELWTASNYRLAATTLDIKMREHLL